MALLLILAATGLWLAKGARIGWTQTSVLVNRTDEVTGITVGDPQPRFLPGVDFLAVAPLASGLLAGASFLLPNKPTQT